MVATVLCTFENEPGERDGVDAAFASLRVAPVRRREASRNRVNQPFARREFLLSKLVKARAIRMSCACPSCSNLQAFSCPWHTPYRRTPRGPLRSTSTRSHTHLSEAVCALFFYVWSCAMDRRAPADGGNYKKAEEKRGEELALCLPLPSLRPPRRTTPASCSVDIKLAAIAVGLRVRPRVADMPLSMQERAFRCTRSLVEAAPNRRNPNLTLLALALKKEFDASYGPAWHCVVGRSFGSYLTHSPGGFVYFSLDGGDDANLSLLLFQTHLLPL